MPGEDGWLARGAGETQGGFIHPEDHGPQRADLTQIFIFWPESADYLDLTLVCMCDSTDPKQK